MWQCYDLTQEGRIYQNKKTSFKALKHFCLRSSNIIWNLFHKINFAIQLFIFTDKGTTHSLTFMLYYFINHLYYTEEQSESFVHRCWKTWYQSIDAAGIFFFFSFSLQHFNIYIWTGERLVRQKYTFTTHPILLCQDRVESVIIGVK